MFGYCENCAKREECKKDIGIIFGGCTIDFEPKDNEEEGQK